mmetsp:Transcript_16302/g.29459  ORF Transcript_16302/g.29459 Transcript_16302/m.29459 type:complete len:174 (-) Transcript_16302:838-1359(-)
MRSALQSRLLQQQFFPKNTNKTFVGFEYGRQSGMYWYPPGGVREWHTNYLDLIGNAARQSSSSSSSSSSSVSSSVGGAAADDDDDEKTTQDIFASQVWRMYFVRTTRDEEFDLKSDRLRKSAKKGGGEGVVDDDDNGHGQHNRRRNENKDDRSAMHIIPGDDSDITLGHDKLI